MNNQTEKKWYQKPVTVVLFLIFFFPVGLFLMWKHEVWTKTTRLIVTVILGLFLIANIAGKNTVIQSDLIGESYNVDTYHMVKFTTSMRYEISQFTNAGKSCIGEGTWSYNDGVITLNRNNSICSSTKNISGQYKISGKWLEK